MPQISIITPAFNNAATLAETLRAVQIQGFGEWEMILVDDCSSDGTGALVEGFSGDDSRIRLIRRAENGGAAKARNQAIAAAKGRYLAFLDANDLWLPEKLEQQFSFMQETQSAVCTHAYRRFYPNGTIGRILRGPKRVTFDTLATRNPIALSTVMIDQQRTGPIQFDESGKTRADLALWLQLTKSGHDILLLPEYLGNEHVQAKSWLHEIATTWKSFRRAGGMTFGQSCLSLFNYALYGVWKRLF